MNPRFLLLIAFFGISVSSVKAAGEYEWANFVGLQGGAGSVNGTGPAARFDYPSGVTVDSASGDIFVADQNNHTIRRITSAGVTSTLAGLAGAPGSTNSPSGPGSLARFDYPAGITADGSGNLYVADSANNTIRKIVIATGVVTTLAGNSSSSGNTDSPSGPGSTARFDFPTSVTYDGSGNLYVADSGNNTIRKIVIATEAVTTIAGSTSAAGSTDSPSGPGTAALFDNPTGVIVGNDGNIYVADQNNFTIRKIVPGSGAVTTLAGTAGFAGKTDGTGTAAKFEFPSTLTVDANGDLFVADSSNHLIRKVTTAGVVTTLAGIGNFNGSTDGAGAAALFDFPTGIASDLNGNLYVSDSNNHTIRKIVISTGVVTTHAASGGRAGSTNGTGTTARFKNPTGLAVDQNKNVFVADTGNSTIRKATGLGAVTKLAGDPGFAGSDNGTGDSALFDSPSGIAVDDDGNVYVADTNNHTIRKISSTGLTTTFAGSAGVSGSTDAPSGPATVARFHFPAGLALDDEGNLYVADTGNSIIRKITPAGVVSTLAGLAENTGSTDDTGNLARFNSPNAVAVDDDGNVYVADTNNHTVRKITPAGVTSTLAGLAENSGSTDNTGSLARFMLPKGIAVEADGNIVVADTGNLTIRKVTPNGLVTTIGGNPGVSGGNDGVGSIATFSEPTGVTVSPTGQILVTDSSNNRITAGSPPTPGFSLEQPANSALEDSTGVVDFGSVNEGESSAAFEFTIRNTGGSTLAGIALSVTGGNTADFAVSTPGNTTLATDETTTFNVTFTPSTSGTHIAILHVVTNDPLQPSYDITLTGLGGDYIAPTLTSVSLTSNNPTVGWARPGNTVTLSLTSSETIQTPTVILGGDIRTATNTGGNNWTASFIAVGSTAQGVITFSIAFKDPSNNNGTTVTSTTNASSITYDRVAPTLTLPNPVFVESSGGGEIANFTVTATDNIVTPVVQTTPASGTVFPLGITTVTATATDTAGNQSSGTFQVIVAVIPEDSIKPAVKILSPKANSKEFGGTGSTVVLSGIATDNLGIIAVGVSFNGGTYSPAALVLSGTGASWSLTVSPDNGTNTISVIAFDQKGNVSPTVSSSFKLINERPLVAGAYCGLSEPTGFSTTPGDHVGILNLNVLGNGVFTGKIVLGGSTKAFPMTGTFGNEGAARFGKTGASLLTITHAGKATVSLGLTLDVDSPGTDKVIGTLEEAGSITVASINADRSLYTSKANPVPPLQNVPVTLINPATDKGKYTAILQAKTPAEQGQAASTFPQGDGWAKVSVLKTGLAKAVGKLADGTSFSCVRPLSKANEWPFYVPLYKAKGSLSGVVSFRDVASVSDADGLNLLWIKPANATDKLYRNGWPNGIETDFYASKYVPPASGSGQSALLADGETLPSIATNATIALSDGFLSAATSNDVSVSDTSKITVTGTTATFTGVENLKCTLSTSTGVMSGSFIHPVSLKNTVFKGVVFQKQQFGCAYFIGSPAPGSPTTTTPESGAIILEPAP